MRYIPIPKNRLPSLRVLSGFTYLGKNIDGSLKLETRQSLDKNIYIFKIKDESRIPQNLSDISLLNQRQTQELMDTRAWQGTSAQQEYDFTDFVTGGKLTRGETIEARHYDLVKYKTRLRQAGLSETEAETRTEKIRGRQ